VVPGDTLTGVAEPTTLAREGNTPNDGNGPVVLLAGRGYTTDIVANFLDARVPDLVVIVEDPIARLQMARRRARQVGWISVGGQVLFVAALYPVLRYLGARRRSGILGAASVDTTYRGTIRRVRSVNDDETVALLASVRPSVVVVQGTRIIASRVLNSLDCPVINVHAGITPRYRGVHGGYWALAEQHPEWVGSTVHLVDPGIDTGEILAQATFEVSNQDSIATYPDLHLVQGLPLLGAQVAKAMAGQELETMRTSIAPGSNLYYHPTFWGYLRRRWCHGVR
jgi:folate-dependent phosphoribosylglycinamide formyltransferase PurN